jgi:RNA polymerase sigma-70 factor, ECF subfamily
MRIAVNVGRDFYRRQRRSSAVFRPMTERDDPAAEPVDATAALDEVHWLLGHLGPDDRTLLTLFYLEQLSIKQIASNLDWSESKTKVRLHRCRNKLRQILSDNGYEEF